MDNNLPLFETRSSRRRCLHKLYVASVSVAILLVLVYRVANLAAGSLGRRCIWMGMFFSELWFGLYWALAQVVLWNPICRYTFKDRLSQRYEKDLPGIDILVCTADPELEPPAMVVSTVLSVMAYNYPPEKLSVYLSDDGGSDLTFYAMLEASRFAKHWLPFCRKFKVEPRAPEAYFRMVVEPPLHLEDAKDAKDWLFVKKLYLDMKNKIEATAKLGQVPEEIRREHKGFREWYFLSSKQDHQTIVQVLINGRDLDAKDSEGQTLPTLVYLAREKRPKYHHNFKAGAMNALIRVSARISNAPIVLNLDCDMYSNNSDSISDALCFFMDEEKGHGIAYVQYPQSFENITNNDIYGNSLLVLQEVELRGLDGNGGPCYIGTGCFFRRDALCGRKYDKECKIDWKMHINKRSEESAEILEEGCKILASCTYEENTQWGKEMGLKYGCPVEDIITGLAIKCRGWKPVTFTPKRKAFLGLAPTTLLQTLVQHKRWSEGHIQIFLSRYCSLVYGHKRIPLRLQLSYCRYNLGAANCLATLYYVIVPSLCLLRGVSLFPQSTLYRLIIWSRLLGGFGVPGARLEDVGGRFSVLVSSIWFQPLAYSILASCLYDLVEFLCCGGTLQGWWNDQRMWLFKRTTSYLLGLFDSILKLLGITKSGFVVTAKVAAEDVSLRYEKEIMEFGVASPMFSILATLSLFNLFSFLGGMKIVIVNNRVASLNQYATQILLSGVLVVINLPIYHGLFFRKDNGKIPTRIVYQSIIIAILIYSIISVTNY